jgi:hypothetical protein
VNPCSVQIVRPAAQPQIGDRRLAALRMRDHVIELQQATLAAAPPVVSEKRAAALVTNVHLSRDSGCYMTAAFRAGTLQTFRSRSRFSRAHSDRTRLPAHAIPLFQQLTAQRLERTLHHTHQLALGLRVTEERPHLLQQLVKLAIRREIHAEAVHRQRFDRAALDLWSRAFAQPLADLSPGRLRRRCR